MGAPTNRSYAAGFFQILLDGARTTAYLKSVEGGWMKHAAINERYGSSNIPINHSAVAEIEPISFEFGLSGANSVLHWIKQSWNKEYSRRSGQIDHADFDCKVQSEHEFSDALIMETTFPTLDGASKDAGYLKCKIQPERVVHRPGGGHVMDANMGKHQKLWTCACFRLTLDGMDCLRYVNKIESFTVKQGVKKMSVGKRRDSTYLPTKIEFPNLKVSMSLAYAQPVIDWYNSYVRMGKKDSEAQKTGTLEFLAPDRKTVLFRIDLWRVGIISATVAASTANSDQIKRLTFELSVEEMKIDGRFIGFD